MDVVGRLVLDAIDRDIPLERIGRFPPAPLVACWAVASAHEITAATVFPSLSTVMRASP